MMEWYRKWKYKKGRYWKFYLPGDGDHINGIAIEILKGKWQDLVFAIEPIILDNNGKFTYNWEIVRYSHDWSMVGSSISKIIDEIVEQAMNEIISNYRGLRQEVMNEQEDRTSYSEEFVPERTVCTKNISLS